MFIASGIVFAIICIIVLPMSIVGSIAYWNEERDTLAAFALFIPPIGLRKYLKERRKDKKAGKK